MSGALTAGVVTALAAPATASRRLPRCGDPDFVVVNARVWTADLYCPTAEAFAVRDGVFTAVGSSDDVRRLATSRTNVIDAQRSYIVPGLIDTHNHSGGNGTDVLFRALVGNPYTIESFSVARIIDILSKESQTVPANHWVEGLFFDDTKIEGGAELRKENLDRVSTDQPVRVLHRGGHTAWYNSRAFEIAGITSDTPDPEFGSFVRDEDGNLTGQVTEDAREAFADVAAVVPLPDDADVKGLAHISKKFVEYGLTSVHMSTPNVDALRRAREAGDLLHRANVEPSFAELEKLSGQGISTGSGDNWIKWGAMAEYALDGSFSERTLRSVEPYKSKAPPHGLFTASQQEADDVAETAMRAGFDVNLHTNGDAAIDRGLNAVERARHHVPVPPRHARIDRFRPRFTHATIVNESLDLLHRLRAVDGVPQVFTTYIYYNSEKWHLYGAEIMSRAMPFNSYADAGVVAATGTDFSPGPFDSLMGIQGMVTRTGWNGQTWGPNQAVSVDEALRVHTVNGAHAGHEEHVKGSITPGKLADYVQLADDPHKTAPNKIIDIELLRTVVGGQTKYTK